LNQKECLSSICFGRDQNSAKINLRPSKKIILKNPNEKSYALKSNVNLRKLISQIDSFALEIFKKISDFRILILKKLMKKKITKSKASSPDSNNVDKNFLKLQKMLKSNFVEMLRTFSKNQRNQFNFKQYLTLGKSIKNVIYF
jgi:hypothetical protein